MKANELQLWKAIEEFLARTPIEGREAETMVLCKQLVRKQQNPPPDLPAPAGK